jgi:integrase
LIEERKLQLKSEDEHVKHQAEMDLKGFIKHLEERELAPNTRRAYFMAIRNFYKRNYLELQFFRGDGPRNQTVAEGRRAASKNDIRKMLEVSSPKVHALILFLKDTGLAESDVAKLKLKDLPIKAVSKIFRLLKPPAPLTLNRTKTGRRTIAFIGKEAFPKWWSRKAGWKL